MSPLKHVDAQTAHQAAIERIGRLSREELEARFKWVPPDIDDEPLPKETPSRKLWMLALVLLSIGSVVGLCIVGKKFMKK